MKKLLLILLCLPMIGFGQNVNIPDANFKAYLVGELDINTNGDTEIQVSEASAFNSYISCNAMNISDLTGIEAFTALTSLYCSDNQLTILDVSNNIALFALYCRNNQLTTLDVSDATALVEFDCSDNLITSLDVRNGNNINMGFYDTFMNNGIGTLNNPHLSCINVDDSTFSANTWANGGWFEIDPHHYFSTNCQALTKTYVPDDNFEAYLETNGMGNGIANDDSVFTHNIDTLTFLYINGQNISDLTGIEAFTGLNIFYCEGNQLTSLDLSNNIVLTVLNCSTNVLTSLNLSQNTALEYLECGLNQLTSLDVSGATALTDLYCDINQLTSLDVSNNTALTHLSCWINQLTNLDLRNGNNTASYIYTQNNPNLFCINVDDPVWSATNWTGIDPWSSFSYSCGAPQTYVPDDNFEQALITLGYDNVLDDSVITANINTVTNLDISSINIYDLTGIEDFTALTSLHCGGNQLTTLDVNYNTALTHLHCGANQLIMIDISNNTNLTTLSCVGNQLTSLDLSQNVNLDTLNCNGNLLTSLDLNYNTAISELSVGFNNPMIIDFSMLLNLKSLWFYNLLELDLSNNSILENLGGGWNDQYLSYVNIQNGNNVNLTCDGVLPLSCGSFKNHQNLTCIQVDDVSWANTNWIDNVAWNGSPAIDTTFQYFSTNCALPSSIEEHSTNKELLKVTDLLGRETKQNNQPLLYLYDDGTVEKRIVIE